MPRFRVMLVVAVSLVALAGCTAMPAPSATPTRAPSATPAATPLACADLADRAQLATALDGSATPRDPMAAELGTYGSRLAFAAAIPAAGGLSCSWLGAAGPAGTPDLAVELLPDPENHWTAMLFGDGPATETDTFGSHTATADFGDPGYGVTTRVNGIWFDLRLNEPALDGGVDQAGAARVLAQAKPMIAAMLDRVAGASPAELAWPTTPPRGGGITADTCRQYLKPETLSSVLGRRLDYMAPVPLGPTSFIEDLAMQRAGYPDCLVLADGNTEFASFQVAVGAAKRLEALRAGIPAPANVTFTPATLAGLPSRDWAIQSGSGDVVFTLGDDVVESSDALVGTRNDPRTLAEAIVGQAY